MSAMNDLFADLDDDVLSPLDDASTSHTHNNGASRYSLGGDSASASTSTLNHHHHQQLAHHLDQHHHQQQHLHQPLAMDTSASQSMRPGGAAAPPVWMNQDLPSWLSKQQAAPVSFAASAAEVYTNHQHKSPIFFFFFFFFFFTRVFFLFFFFFFFFFSSAAHSGATPPIPFSRKRSGEHVLDLQPDTSVGSTRRAPPMNPYALDSTIVILIRL
jgi:hypothetical protein